MADQQALDIVRGGKIQLYTANVTGGAKAPILRFELCDKPDKNLDGLSAKRDQLLERMKELYPNIEFERGSVGINSQTGNGFLEVRLPQTPATSLERENTLAMQTALIRDTFGVPQLQLDQDPIPVDDKAGCEMMLSQAPDAIVAPTVAAAKTSGRSVT